MGRVSLDLSYLEFSVPVDENDNEVELDIQKQLEAGLYGVWIERDLGCVSMNQKEHLHKNSTKITNAMCFIKRHWDVFLRVLFPRMPPDADGKVSGSILLKTLSRMERTGGKK